MIINQPPVSVELLTGQRQLRERLAGAREVGAPLPGMENVLAGGNMNAFIDAIEQVFEESLAIGERVGLFDGSTYPNAVNIYNYVRVDSVDPNPIDGTAAGAVLGDRIYVKPLYQWQYGSPGPLREEDLGDQWIVALYNGYWYQLPDGHGPLNPIDPWASPGTTPYIAGYTRIPWPAGIIPAPPGGVVWTPSEEPTLDPAGTLLVPEWPGPYDPNGNGNGNGTGNGKMNLVPLALGAAALFFLTSG